MAASFIYGRRRQASRSEACLSHAGPIRGLVGGILGAVGVHTFELRIGHARTADGGRRRVTAAGARSAAIAPAVRRRPPRSLSLAARFLDFACASPAVLPCPG